ncbi:MAG TPA: methyl-accepting chemotaxis protein, partial [Eoetvoesiella sp.]
MSWLASLTVRTKLTGSFLIVAVIAALIGWLGVRATGEVNTMAASMHDVELVGLHHTATAHTKFIGAGRSARTALLAQTFGERDVEVKRVAAGFADVKSELDQMEALFVTEEGKESVVQARTAVLAYEAGIHKVLTLLKPEPPGQANDSTIELLENARPLGDAAEALMDKLVDDKRLNAARFAGEIASVYSSTVVTLAVLTIAGAILAMLLGWFITRALTRQLGGEPAQVAAIADSIASGNLTNHIDMSQASRGSVIVAMNTMQEGLRKLVTSVLASSDSIATGAGQIAAGNADLSQRTEEQAANLTETAAAMEELSSTVHSNADVARQAAQRATTASASASKGGEVVDNVVATMAGINDSSRRIVEIIGVIDSIAFQTNILALNAAVEAARAGEQGRGFAVVASEVRSLAQKSAAAAKDIKTLIDDSVAKADAGSRLVDEAGAAMQGIVAEVRQVTDLISEISAATTEQTSGLGQINDAVLQLSDATQQNAALVEESAIASTSLSEQAGMLVDVVSFFKVDQNGTGAAAPALASQRMAPPKVAASSYGRGESTPARPTASAAR